MFVAARGLLPMDRSRNTTPIESPVDTGCIRSRPQSGGEAFQNKTPEDNSQQPKDGYNTLCARPSADRALYPTGRKTSLLNVQLIPAPFVRDVRAMANEMGFPGVENNKGVEHPRTDRAKALVRKRNQALG